MIDFLNISIPLWLSLVPTIALITTIIGLIIQHGHLKVARKQARVTEKDAKFQWLNKKEEDYIEDFKVYMHLHAKTDPKVLTVKTIVGDCKASLKKFRDRNKNQELIPELEKFVERGKEIISGKANYN
ncbi:hypothetical protein ACFL1W_01155 [Candidatus Margulisiibacteriota bacterium]